MKRPVRALYKILICTVLYVTDIKASDDLQMIAIDSDSENKTPISPLIQNKDMNLLPELLDNPLYHFACFVLTKTEKIKMAHYSCSPSNSTEIHNYDIDQLKENTEQIDSLSSSYSTVCESDIECSPICCIPNKPVQNHTESESLGNYKQLSKAKRPKNAIEENIPRKKQKKTKENSLYLDSVDNNELDNNRIKKIKRNISIWNNARLKNRHRKGLPICYKLALLFNKFRSNIYIEIGDEKHKLLIETHVKHCKAVYSEIPAQNEFWFAIASRTSYMHTKLADCKAMNTKPSDYKFIEGLSGYYPGLPGDIVRYMDTHGSIISRQENIKTEWTETLGDIHVRIPIEPEYGINKEIITFKGRNEYRSVATVVQMILALPEVHKDLSNITSEFVENTLEEETDSNHLAVVRALYKIVEKHKSSKKSNIDEEYAVLYNIFASILHQTNVSYKSIVIQLYTEMYKSLTYFYEKAEVCEGIQRSKRKNKNGEKEYYLLAGKCIIKQQRYLKCTTTIDLRKPMSEYVHEITEKTNKWIISSDIQKHYHIHYVDNTKQKYVRVCMPIYLGPIHTISQTIEYLKRLYGIEKNKCLCPYRRNSSGNWMYIQEEERNRRVQEFADCDIVFYYIEEGIRENYFTFAEFESYKRPKGKTVRIPLFLRPLMRSAISMGPFEEKDKIKHKVVDNMQYMWILPDVYAYNSKYKTIDYSDVHYYYTNLYIQRDNADVPTIGCYIMDSKAIMINGTVIVEWYAKVPNSVDEYMHCILSDDLINDQEEYNAFSKAISRQEYTPDCTLYGFGLQSSLVKTCLLESIGYSTDNCIDLNNIANYKMSIVSMHKIPTNPKIADIQSKIDKINIEVKQITMRIKEPGITEELKKELKRKRKNSNWIKYRNIKKINKMQPEDQLLIKEESSAIPLPLCSFLVFRHSNTQTKSSLGAHNEIFDIFTYKYN